MGFRPFFELQERRPGEFQNLRVCRQLGTETKESRGKSGKSGKWPRSFDVELIRWGEAATATPQDFAEALFPPSGKPPSKAAAAWQLEVFHRIFQKDASNYVAGAVWLILREALQRRVRLLVQDQAVVEVGLAQGMFFQPPPPHGPTADTVEDRAVAGQADALAICTGEDRRLFLVPSFTTLGVPHRWLLLRVAGSEQEQAEQPEHPKQPERVVAVDLCCGALGLLGDGTPAIVSPIRVWEHGSDQRYVVRRSAWGEDALNLAQPPMGGASQMRVALRSMLAASGLNWDSKLGDELVESVSQQPSTPQMHEDTSETARRLHDAVKLLGISVSFPPSFPDDASDADIAAVHTVPWFCSGKVCGHRFAKGGL